MITLELVEPGWVRGPEDDPADRCAHGCVRLRVDDVPLVDPEEGQWAVSAAALFLLRTLSASHTAAGSVTDGNLLFPCCGHALFLAPDTRYGFVCVGCPNGVDVEVAHAAGRVELRRADGRYASVDRDAWHDAVCSFADEVEALYARSAPKVELDEGEDRDAWARFWDEWRSRRRANR